MNETELVNAVLTELKKNKIDISTTSVINALKGGEMVVCYDGDGNMSRIEPQTISTANKVYLTEREYQELVLNNDVKDNVEYNIYEE
jgi:hypothetical protein